MPINCVDSPIGDAAPLFAQGQAFQNPLAISLQNAISQLTSFLLNPTTDRGLLMDPQSLLCLTNLQAALPVFMNYTNFVSGVTPQFPVSILTAPFLAAALPANTATLATLTFAEMLGALSGGLNSQSAMCQTNPNDPCVLVTAILGIVGESGTAQVQALASGLNAIVSHTLGMTICAWVTKMLEALAGLIAAGLAAILNALALAANYALGKVIQFLAKHPCFSAFLGAVATPSLQDALNL